MASDYASSHAALIARADRAIADAVATRAEVWAGLNAAGQRCPVRPWVGDPRPSKVAHSEPLPPLGFLDLWCSVARAFADAGEIIREADMELERGWRRILPTIETPLSAFGDMPS